MWFVTTQVCRHQHLIIITELNALQFLPPTDDQSIPYSIKHFFPSLYILVMTKH